MGIMSYLHLLQNGAYASIVGVLLTLGTGGLAGAALWQVAALRRELAATRPRPRPDTPPPPPPSAYPIPPRPGTPYPYGAMPGVFGGWVEDYPGAGKFIHYGPPDPAEHVASRKDTP